MQELRFVAVSEDGRYAVLAVPGRSARFTLPIDERLRAVALGQTSRLAQYEIEVESPLRPKEIQARIRAGETVEEIADAAGIAIERVRWFEGPVLAERAYVAEQAQAASVRRPGEATPSAPGQSLGEIVAERLGAFGVDPEDAQWDAKKRGDANWQVELTFISSGRLHAAEWVFDPRRRHVLPADDNAARMSLPGAEPLQPAAPPPGEATVTHLAPRLSAAAGNGGSSHTPPPARPEGGRPGVPVPASPAPSIPVTSARPPAPVREPEPAAPAKPAPRPAAPRPAPPHQAPPRQAPSRPATASAVSAAPAARAEQPAARPAQQTTQQPAQQAAPKAAAPAPEPASQAAASADAAGEAAGRASRKNARGRRSSVPSWDEIMFGNKRD